MLDSYLVALMGLFYSILGADSYIISDNRVRSLDITPTLGRGYSIMTNSYQSICLSVEETTVPSYNYDYSFYDFSKQTTSDEVTSSTATTVSSLKLNIAKVFGFSFGYHALINEVEDNADQSKVGTNYRYMASSMRIERYYSSVREDVSALSADATALLDRQDYIGFFKACGPTYIRGIRRAQEVVAYIIFNTFNESGANEYVQDLRNSRVNTWAANRDDYSRTRTTKTKFNNESQSTTIILKGWGMGLSQEGSETLVATTFDEYEEVMHFAFKTMTTSVDSVHIGMVYGMEVIPWVENTSFQVRSQVLDQTVQIPLIRSLIPQADSDGNCIQGYEKDKYGYCCDPQALYDPETRQYDAQLPLERICRPLRTLDPALMKSNMAANGEFIARLDRSVRYKLNQMSTLEKCISAARAIPDRYDFFILKGEDTNKVDLKEINFSLFELKMAIDPFQDYSLLTHMAKELDEWFDMFIQPCYAALFGTNVGFTPSTDVSYLMAYPWHSHDICTKLSCFGNSMRWDRSSPSGGCVSSLIAGSSAMDINAETDSTNCKQSVDTGELTCMHSTLPMSASIVRTKKCWSETVPRGQVDFFLDAYCMPQLTDQELDSNAAHYLKLGQLKNCNKDTPFLNVALKRPVRQSKTVGGYEAFKGNDGDKSTLHNVAIAKNISTGSSWEVDLQSQYKLQKIVIYNRGDCCLDSIEGIQVELQGANGSTIVPLGGSPSIGTGTAKAVNELVFTTPPENVQKVILKNTKDFGFTEVEVIAYALPVYPWLEGPLYPGQKVYSEDFTKELTLDQGNLVLRDVNTPTTVIWTSGLTEAEADKVAFVDMTGKYLELVDAVGNIVKTVTTDVTGDTGDQNYIKVENSGIKLYDTIDGTPIQLWSS